MVSQAGLEPTMSERTQFTVGGDTNYTLLAHMVGGDGFEPSFLELQSSTLTICVTLPYLEGCTGLEPVTFGLTARRSTN